MTEMIERESAAMIAEYWVPPVGGFDGYSAKTAHRVCREIAERIRTRTVRTPADDARSRVLEFVEDDEPWGNLKGSDIEDIKADIRAALGVRAAPETQSR